MVERRRERMITYRKVFGSMCSARSLLRTTAPVNLAFRSALPDNQVWLLQAPLREEVRFLSLDGEETEVVGEGNLEEEEEEEEESSVRIPSPLPQEKQTDYVCQGQVHQALPMLPEIKSSAPVGGRLSAFWKNWELARIEESLVELIKLGYKLILVEKPHLIKYPKNIALPGAPEKRRALLQIVKDLLKDNVIEVVKEERSPGYYNHFFITPKAEAGKWRPILDLKVFNFHMLKETFKMETAESIRKSLQLGDWVTSLDLKLALSCSHSPSVKEVSVSL